MSRFKQNKVIQVLGLDVNVKPMSFETFGKVARIQKKFKETEENEMAEAFVELASLVKEVILETTDITEEEILDIGAVEQMNLIGQIAQVVQNEAEKKMKQA